MKLNVSTFLRGIVFSALLSDCFARIKFRFCFLLLIFRSSSFSLPLLLQAPYNLVFRKSCLPFCPNISVVYTFRNQLFGHVHQSPIKCCLILNHFCFVVVVLDGFLEKGSQINQNLYLQKRCCVRGCCTQHIKDRPNVYLPINYTFLM